MQYRKFKKIDLTCTVRPFLKQKYSLSGLELAPLLSGILLFMAAPGPAEMGLLAWIALVPLFYYIDKAGPGRALRGGLLCGLVFYLFSLYWIIIVLGRYGHLPVWISIPALFLLALYMSLYVGLFGWIMTRCRSFLPWLIAAPFVWVALDFVRSFLFSGFPWQDLAYTQYRFPFIIQISDLVGHYGVTFLIVLVNGLIFSFINRLGKKGNSFRDLVRDKMMIGPALLIIVVFTYNGLRMQQVKNMLASSETTRVAVIQGNIRQGRNWDPAYQATTITRYLSLSRQVLKDNRPELVIWPETAMPFYPTESPTFRKVAKQVAGDNDIFLLTGAPHRQVSPANPARYFNSAFLVGPDGKIRDKYDKQHLVPFGEYIPLRKILPLPGPLVESIGDFSAGRFSGPLQNGKTSLGVLICFESIFPEIARQHTAAGANLLVNITNDAWFGRSSAPRQHLAMAVLRAVENRRSLARAANTGISAFITPDGRITSFSPLFEQYSITEQVILFANRTVFTHYGGHWFAFVCLIGVALLILFCRPGKKPLA